MMQSQQIQLMFETQERNYKKLLKKLCKNKLVDNGNLSDTSDDQSIDNSEFNKSDIAHDKLDANFSRENKKKCGEEEKIRKKVSTFNFRI